MEASSIEEEPESLFEVIRWIQERSHEPRLTRLVYLYSEDGVEAKQFLMYLMYLDATDGFGWDDSFVIYCSASCFASRASSLLENLPDRDDLRDVTLALFDIQQLANDEEDVPIVLEICQRLAERKANVVLAGSSHPDEVFKNRPLVSCFLLAGHVVKLEGCRMILNDQGIRRPYDLPWVLRYGQDRYSRRFSAFPLSGCNELIFQWEALCTWKNEHGFFDLDLFNDAFCEARKFLRTALWSNDVQAACCYRSRLLMFMCGFIGGLLRWRVYSLMDYEPNDAKAWSDDPSNLQEAEDLVRAMLIDRITAECV